MNPYKILDLPTSASNDEIRKKYKSLAQLHHPDRGGDEELFKLVKQAYEILSDPDRRKQYDETGSTTTTKSKNDEAIDQLAYLFFNVMHSVDMNSSNLIGVMYNRINEELINLLSKKSSIDEEIANCKILNQKITKKVDDNENIFDQFLNHHISNLVQQKESIQYKIDVFDIMLGILKEYDYHLEQ